MGEVYLFPLLPVPEPRVGPVCVGQLAGDPFRVGKGSLRFGLVAAEGVGAYCDSGAESGSRGGAVANGLAGLLSEVNGGSQSAEVQREHGVASEDPGVKGAVAGFGGGRPDGVEPHRTHPRRMLTAMDRHGLDFARHVRHMDDPILSWHIVNSVPSQAEQRLITALARHMATA
ncbi:hypothetical protein [Streptomyces sp. NPDC006638]|uniref:hypothetical protein n=1 Tax=Streptomyces sp. NPDC006638 TaxID=3157183 RepID=UPI0033AFBAF7